jgi:hypothetical protein
MSVVFFDWKGIVHHEFVPRGQMASKQLYQEILAQEEAWIVGKPDWDVAPQQCASSHVVSHPQLSAKTSNILSAPSALFSELSSSRLFPVSHT